MITSTGIRMKDSFIRNKLFLGLTFLVIFFIINLLVLIRHADDEVQIGNHTIAKYMTFGKSKKHSFPISENIAADTNFKTVKISSYKHHQNKKSLNSEADGEDQTENFVFEKEICNDLRYDHEIKMTNDKLLGINFDFLQYQLNKSEHSKSIIETVLTKFNSKIPIENQWIRFAGSSVWLEDLKVHYMVSRLIFSPSGVPNKGFASFLHVQIYDENWNMLIKQLDVPYVKFTKETVVLPDGTMEDIVVDKKFTTAKLSFPSLVPIKFDFLSQSSNNKFYWGPEDPRILKRINPEYGFEEPLIVFNMKDLRLQKRVMHLYLPFSDNLKVLKKTHEAYASLEKNWTPFLSLSTEDDHDKINFVYSIKPLEIMTCTIHDGECDFIQKAPKDDLNYFGSLRGGTQLEKIKFNETLPENLRLKFPENRQIYLGFARTHLNKCGCGESMYRPNLVILVEDYNPETRKFYYKVGDVSDFIDFNVEIPIWKVPKLDDEGNLVEENKTVCDRDNRNVLIPNSIAYWDIDSVEYENILYKRSKFKKFPKKKDINLNDVIYNDYMGVTISASDSDVRIVHLKGLINYILNLSPLFDSNDVVKSDQEFLLGTDFNERCSEQASRQFCIDYANDNGGVVSYE